MTIVSPAVTAARCRPGSRGPLPARRARRTAARRRGPAVALVATGDARVTARRPSRRAPRPASRERRRRSPSAATSSCPPSFAAAALVVAVSTGGASPTLARVVRDELERLVPESYARCWRWWPRCARECAGASTPVPADRWRAAHRRPAARAGRRGAARTRRRRCSRARLGGMSAPRGRVFLVGAGPGDPAPHHGPRARAAAPGRRRRSRSPGEPGAPRRGSPGAVADLRREEPGRAACPRRRSMGS